MDATVERTDCRLDRDFGAKDEEFDMNLFYFWDFPLENVRGDDFVGDWDDISLERLGPTALDALMPPTNQCPNVDTFAVDTHFDESHEPKQLPDHVGIASGSFVPNQNTSAETRESGAFQTQSPDSVVESRSFTGIFGAIPGQRKRSRTFKTRPRLKPWNLVSPWHSAKPGSGRTSNHQNIHKERNKLSGDAVYLLQSSDAGKQLHSGATKKCTHCEITKTPQWREGPLGPKTLCNACGVRYRSGRLFPEYRPAASPTFVRDFHSNSHRKVLEMRNIARDSMQGKWTSPGC
ncbi:GATA transcription factor 11-like [Henckelia pumila]|uniref:GATA transcription factor 11-like n=1 Tax=Henckelia pumila TaxID=405737 RepID=UPI003C6E1CFF